MIERYLEDFAFGQTFGSGRNVVEKENIKAFAAKFDPQPFHLDKATAQDTIFRGLAASGWHTAAMTMRLLVDGEIRLAAGLWVPVRRIPLATSCATRRRAAS
ncbi:MaoC/PaaZ C-terminal domain-containing protein [Mesorhizobium sp.]|uniref:MaoC/PaaZ C-terminal domain-containing protein n=1 Tax=Mesorhizobium sp. TaxID=1871066 RepID=UPI002579625E|nr:MaoC/PaaZ C-terminal domain-containing protein [Mesorhizobium sp.]